MQSKSLLIAIAAFAVTTSGVFAYSGDSILERANLSAEQKSAITRARELKETGDIAAARDSLVEAGIDEEVLKKLHQAKNQVHEEMQAALEAGDYEAFLVIIAETPLAEIITSEADFEQFQAAHAYKAEGNFVAAKEIFGELGVEPGRHHHGSYQNHGHWRQDFMAELSVEQKDAFQVARQANDRSTMQAILDEAGIVLPGRR